jgi:hypothetical protein
MNESMLFTLANIGIVIAGFSGVVAAFHLPETRTWSTTEIRVLWLLLGDSLLVVFFSLIPVPMSLANLSESTIWGFSSAILGSWFIIGFLLAIRGEIKDRRAGQLVIVPVITPILYVVSIIALVMSIVLWFSVWDFIVPRGEAFYVIGLIILLAFASVEFLFFIGLMSQGNPKSKA